MPHGFISTQPTSSAAVRATVKAQRAEDNHPYGPHAGFFSGQDSGSAHAEEIKGRNDGHENNREEIDSNGDFRIGISGDFNGGSSSGSGSSLGLTNSSGGEPQIAKNVEPLHIR